MNSNIWNSFRENCKGDYVLDMKRYGRSENCIRSTMCSFDALIWELFGVCAKVKKSFAKTNKNVFFQPNYVSKFHRHCGQILKNKA